MWLQTLENVFLVLSENKVYISCQEVKLDKTFPQRIAASALPQLSLCPSMKKCPCGRQTQALM